MNSLSFATVRQLRDALLAKKISVDELLNFFMQRFTVHDGKIGAALEIFDKKWIAQNVKLPGILHGIPGLIKNIICVQGHVVTCGSRILKDFRSPYDATVVVRLKNQGGAIIGSANLDEFAMGSSTETSYFQKTKNPWDLTRVPGGSSGGSAAAVAAGLVPWALGTDTGGSVRQPAAFCGVVGLKPTYGLVSRYGLVSYASSLDQIGVLTRSVYDSALILSIIAGKDEHDSSSLQGEPKDYTKQLNGSLPSGLRIGIVDNALNATGIDAEVVMALEHAIAEFKKLGAAVQHVIIPAIEYGAAAYFILSRAEAASNLARFDGVRYGFRNKQASTLRDMYEETRHDGFGPEVRRRIMIGNYVLSAGHAAQYYENACKVKALIRSQCIDIFKEVDVLFMPVHPAPAFKLGAFDVDRLQMDLQDYFTCPINLAGVPSISVPCGMSKNGLPIGFQLVGLHGAEDLLFKVAHAYETVTPWHTMHPPLFS